MKCETCELRNDCESSFLADECDFYEPDAEAMREEREAYEVDKGDAKRKGYE